MSENDFDFCNFIEAINRQADKGALEANIFLVFAILFGPVLVVSSVILGA